MQADPEKIWGKYGPQLKIRFLEDYTAKKYRKSQHLPDDFTSGIHPKFVDWAIRSYIRGGIRHIGHIRSRLITALETYVRLQPSLDPKQRDINAFCGLDGCIGKWNQWVPGLDDVIYPSKIAPKVSLKPAYIDEKCSVYIPETQRESCHIGQGTKWCTASTIGDNHFDNYRSEGRLYVIVPVGGRRKYQLHLEKKEFMDDSDEPIDITDLIEMFPDALDFIFSDRDTGIIMIGSQPEFYRREDLSFYSSSRIRDYDVIPTGALKPLYVNIYLFQSIMGTPRYYLWDGEILVDSTMASSEIIPDIFTEEAVRLLPTAFYTRSLSRRSGIHHGYGDWIGFVWSVYDKGRILYIYDGKVHTETSKFRDHLQYDLEMRGTLHNDEIHLYTHKTILIFSYPG